jgi:hypothetical protein
MSSRLNQYKVLRSSLLGLCGPSVVRRPRCPPHHLHNHATRRSVSACLVARAAESARVRVRLEGIYTIKCQFHQYSTGLGEGKSLRDDREIAGISAIVGLILAGTVALVRIIL